MSKICRNPGRCYPDSDSSGSDSSPSLDREKRLQMYMDTFPDEKRAMFSHEDNIIDGRGRHKMTFRDFCSIALDMSENEGFDIEDYSKVCGLGVILRLHYPPDEPAPDEELTDLKACAGLAIRKFNKVQKTKFRDVIVLKANVEAHCPVRYYITFEATDKKKNSQVFQAIVNVRIPITRKEVEMVRIKTAPKLFHIPRPRDSSL